MQHYYRHSRRRRGGGRRLVSDYLRGVTVEFLTAPGVFSGKEIDEGTRLLIEHARVPEQGTVLDLGAGYGAIGITLAKAHPGIRVVMVEVNPDAAELAKQNARLNRVEDRVEVLVGDLYEPVRGRKFRLIISNPPLAAGMETVERIVEEAPAHLEDNGTLQLVLRKGENRVLNLMKQVFPKAAILLRKKGYTILYAEKTPEPR